MLLLAIGLVLFLGVHSLRILAPALRERWIARLGEGPYKGLYSLASLVGFILLLYGYGLARADPVPVWFPPAASAHLALLLVPVAFILFASAYAPLGRIKASVGHPMLLGTALWALGHLLANGMAADLLLFGGFLVWAVLAYLAARRRDREEGVVRRAKGWRGDIVAIAIGLAAAALFLAGLHRWLFGVSPLG